MTKKVPVWVRDDDGHSYHLKKDREGHLYLVDKGLCKSCYGFGKSEKDLYIGYTLDARSVDYGRYVVYRNDLLDQP